MNGHKSIIGCGYISHNAQAICLKTYTDAKLGEGVYKIIKDPYELVLGGMRLRPRKYMAVNVLDAFTGLTYAVKYEPANLVRRRRNLKSTSPASPSILRPVPCRSPRSSKLCSTLRGGNFGQVRCCILCGFGRRKR